MRQGSALRQIYSDALTLRKGKIRGPGHRNAGQDAYMDTLAERVCKNKCGVVWAWMLYEEPSGTEWKGTDGYRYGWLPSDKGQKG